MNGNMVNILLVEDNPGHVKLITRNFKDHRVINLIKHVWDGEEALDYLFQRGKYTDPQTCPRPQVVLLDLRLPKIDGLDVLKEIKSDETLKNIPVVILTTSEAESDIARAYEYNANSYLVKPVNFENFTQLMDILGFYWLAWNKNSPDSNQ